MISVLSSNEVVAGAAKIPPQKLKVMIMRTMTKEESNSIGGGLLPALGLTGVAEGLELTAIGGALTFAWGVGYGIGTVAYRSYDYIRYGEFD